MYIDIKPKYVRGLACYEGALVVIASSVKREYQLAFSDTFCFAYLHKNAPTVGEKIVTSNEDFYENIKKYCGIEIYPISSGPDIHNIMKRMVDTYNAVGVETDAYYCPWSFEFKKNKHGHHYLIVDYNDNGYSCIDTTMYEKIYNIDYENFSLGFKGGVGFKINDINNEVNYKEILSKSIVSIINSTCVQDTDVKKIIEGVCEVDETVEEILQPWYLEKIKKDYSKEENNEFFNYSDDDYSFPKSVAEEIIGYAREHIW